MRPSLQLINCVKLTVELLVQGLRRPEWEIGRNPPALILPRIGRTGLKASRLDAEKEQPEGLIHPCINPVRGTISGSLSNTHVSTIGMT